MDKEIERKIHEEASEYLKVAGHTGEDCFYRFSVRHLIEFAKKILEKYGAEGGT